LTIKRTCEHGHQSNRIPRDVGFFDEHGTL
jgi:hypothetical protein